MFPILYEKNETNFLHNGIGVLSDCISATAKEERNGIFELEIEYDSNGRFADVIENDMIIKAKANDRQDPQLFRIYAVNKSQENDNLKISAQHITYDLAGNFVEKLELNNVTAAEAMEAIQKNLAYPTKFTISSTNTTTKSSTKLYRTNPLQMIGGIDGSIIDNWGGEIERDNFRLILHAHRGSDNGVLVAYKKNLTGLEAKFDTSEVVTRIFPFKVLEDGTVITVPGKFIDSPLIDNYPFIRILPIDASGDEDITDQESLYAAYKNYFNSGAHDKPTVTLEVEFEPLWATEEYEDVAALELIGMGDTITVRNEKMGVDVTAEATKIEYDVLNEKNAKVTAGSIQTRLTDAVNNTTSTVAQGIQQATQTANAALTAANGKNKIFYGPDEPAGANKDDVWFKVVDGEYTRTYRFDGIQWQLVVDADVSAADQAAQAAQAAAEEAKATAANAETVGQAAQQIAAEAEAKGDAAAKAAEEAKDAATKAQSDAASAVTSANNAVDTANKATQDAQDAISKAQDGFDAAQDALSKADTAETNSQSALNTANAAAKDAQSALTAANNATDIANTAKQVASDAATQASTAKTNAQTAMSNAQDAINKANAANANANTREKSIIKSNTAPSNPATDQLWIDTSKTPQIMRRWNGTAWIDLSPTQASQIGAVSTTTYTTDITNINNTLSQKASVTTVNTLSGRVDKAETAITQNANKIELKADKSVVDTLKNTVDNHSTLISQNADAIQLKADKSTVDTLTGRVSTAEATLETQANEIAARITKTDADAKYATQTALKATADSLTSQISSAVLNGDIYARGTGRNRHANRILKINGNDYYNDLNTRGLRLTVLSRTDLSVTFNNDYDVYGDETARNNLADKLNSLDDSVIVVLTSCDAIATNTTLQDAMARCGGSGTGFGYRNPYALIGIPGIGKGNGLEVFQSDDASAPYAEVSTKVINGIPQGINTLSNYINSQFNSLSQTLDSTVSRIGNAEGNISALQQTANSFATRISNAEGNISSLTQTAQGLQTQVTNNKNDIVTVTQTASALQTRITNAEGNISALQQTSDSFATRISNAEGNISTLTQTANGLQAAVSGKVDTTTYNSFVTQTNTALQSKLSAQDAASTYATQSSLTQTANSLTSSITAVQTNLDNLQIGGRNLIRNTDRSDGYNHWVLWGNAQPYTESVYGEVGCVATNHASAGENNPSGIVSSTFSASVGDEFTVSFESIFEGHLTGCANQIEWFDSSDNRVGLSSLPAINGRVLETVKAPSGVSYGKFVQNAIWNGEPNFYVSAIRWLKVEKGNRATDWSPAPEDMATQSQISQLSDDINLRVQKGDVINQINVSTEGILIDGKKVHITGQTTIDNAVIKDAMIQSMTANKLTAGTIDANVINVTNINASNIVTGTLDASKATVANIDASKITTGTLNAERIAAGSIDASKLAAGTITAASGVIGSLDASKITTGTLDAARVSVINLDASNIKTGTLSAVGIHQSNTGQDIWLDQNGFHMKANQLDIWMNSNHGMEVLHNNESKFKVDLNGLMSAVNATVTGSFSSSAKDDKGTWNASLSSGRIAMSKIGDASETGGQYVPIYEANISAGEIYTTMRRNGRPWNYVQMSAGAVGSNDTFISVTANEGDSSALYPDKLVVRNHAIVDTDGLHLDDDIVIGSGGWRALKFQTIRYNGTDYPSITQKDGKAGILFGSGYMYLLCNNKVVNLAEVYWPTQIESTTGRVVKWVNPLK